MVGKLTKVAAGAMQTHASQSEVDLALLARVARDAGASPEAAAEIGAANTARHALDLCRREGLVAAVAERLCRLAAERCREEEPRLAYRATLVDFDGAVLGRHPAGAEGAP
jgi:cobalt-precorrin-5B (C1)-methyltransferase